ncbi:MAG: hypothetical protein QM607_12775 [Microbacterium sp.]
MRKTPAVLTIAALAAVALVGCAPHSGPSSSCDRVDAVDDSLLDTIEVTGDVGTTPDVHVYTPFKTDGLRYADATVGDGEVVGSEEDLGAFDFTLIDGDTGETIYASAYSGDLSSLSLFNGLDSALAGFGSTIECATVGSRIVAAFPSDALSDDARTQLGASADSAIVAVIDVNSDYPSAASGSLVYNDGFGLPSVVRAPDGRPGVIVPDSKAPEKVVSQTLIKGSGDKLASGETAVVKYTAVNWDTKTQIASSWPDSGPGSLPLGADETKVFSDALIGQTIGSQVLLVVPGALADSAMTQLGAPSDAASIWVIDILGTVPTATQ